MTIPIASFNVTTPSSTTPVAVAAQTFSIQPNGALLFLSESAQTVAAFAAGQWTQVEPVAAS